MTENQNTTPAPAGDMAQTGRFSDAVLANAIADALRTNCPDLLQQCIQHQAAVLERLAGERDEALADAGRMLKRSAERFTAERAARERAEAVVSAAEKYLKAEAYEDACAMQGGVNPAAINEAADRQRTLQRAIAEYRAALQPQPQPQPQGGGDAR